MIIIINKIKNEIEFDGIFMGTVKIVPTFAVFDMNKYQRYWG